MGEVWKPVIGYEGLYEVSSHGGVRSLDRVVEQVNRWGRVAPRRLSGKFLTQTVDRGKYAYGRRQVKLCARNEAKTRLVSHLVAEAFIGPRPEGLEVCHNDGDNSNNRVENLRYDTPAGNSADKILHGTQQRGADCWNAKLTEDCVRRIRVMAREQTMQRTADAFGISIAQVSRIVNRQRWAHVHDL